MFIITNKKKSIVVDTGNEVTYWDNGYPVIVEKDVAFVKEDVNVFEVNELPEDFKQGKYCYTEEKGFYVNPDYVEPDSTNTYGVSDNVYHQIIDDYSMELVEKGVI